MTLCAARPELYSDTVSAIRTPDGFNATSIVTHAASAYDVAFGVGLGEVAGKVFRIGHLGDFNDLMLMGTLSGVEMGLAVAGVPHQSGGAQRAMDYLKASAAGESSAVAAE